MKTSRNVFIIFLILYLFFPMITHSVTIGVVKVKEAITPVTEKYMMRTYLEAEEAGYDAVMYTLDTPGGLLESTRNIVQTLLSADEDGLDTIVYVYPMGSRAGSAGVFITLAAKYAAMAPGCNIGAAHPVTVGGGDDDSDSGLMEFLKSLTSMTNEDSDSADETEKKSNSDYLSEKVENDTVAFIESIADVRGRNKEWAVDAVMESVSITSSEALENNVIDFIASNKTGLVNDIYGNDADVEFVEMEKSWGENLLSVLANPNLSYLLLILGLIGIGVEIRNPGSIFPGALGALFFIIGLFSNQVLPMNYAGVFLLILSVVLFILEISITSYGMLTVGGLIAFIIGSAMLFDSPLPFLRVSAGIIATGGIIIGMLMVLLLIFAVPSIRSKAVSGKEGLSGLTGVAVHDFVDGKGQVKVHGEIWSAYSNENIKAGNVVVVQNSEGLKLNITKKINV